MKNITNPSQYKKLIINSDNFTDKNNSINCTLCNKIIGPIIELNIENNESYPHFEPFRIKSNGLPYCPLH